MVHYYSELCFSQYFFFNHCPACQYFWFEHFFYFSLYLSIYLELMLFSLLIFVIRYRRGRISRLKPLSIILRWIWPSDRCTNCQSIYSITRASDMITKNLDHIHRSSDGRFVLSDSSGIEVRPPSAGSSNSSESDDGGFLPRRSGKGRMSWRQPLVSYPSELSFLPTTPSVHSGGLLRIGNGTPQNLLQTVPIEYHNRPTYQNINSISRTMPRNIAILSPHTPSRLSRIISSSPAVSSHMANSTIWSPQTAYFSDLSSVQQPSSADRSFPTPQSNISQLRYLQERYSQELPSLRAIHEETRRMAQGFVPLHVQLHSPSLRSPYVMPYTQQRTPPQQQHHYGHHYYNDHHSHPNYHPIVHQRQRSRLLPRHIRMARSAPELGSPVSHLNTAMRVIEASPESRSSSSGFGSKNTSTQHNQSSQSGSTNEWRYLPPYRPPPPPQYYSYHHHKPVSTNVPSDRSPPYTMEHWLELISRLNDASDHVNIPKAVDVGSVDGHYEFDPATPTPTASTPTGNRDDLILDQHQFTTTALMHTQSLQPYQRKRISKYDNIEARVQAMKEEFHAYRKRQATQQHSGVELESAC